MTILRQGTLAAVSVAAALAVAVPAAADAPIAADIQFYGKANISLQQFESIADAPAVSGTRVAVDNWQINSNASRLGIKGQKSLDGGMEAIFQLEYEVSFDQGAFPAGQAASHNDELKPRNIYVGLRGDWGQVIFGHNDTLLKQLGGPVDVFNDYHNADIRVYLNGEDRRGDMVLYRSPNWNGFRVGVAFSPGEEANPAAATTPPGIAREANTGLADYTGFSAEYTHGERFALGVAVNRGLKDADAPKSGLLSGMRVTARWLDWQGFSAGLLLQSMEDDDGARFFEESAVVISAAYQFSDWKLKLQLGSSEREWEALREGLDPIQDERAQLAFAAEYQLEKRVKLFAYFAAVERDVTRRQADDDAASPVFNYTVSPEDSTVGLGLEYKF